MNPRIEITNEAFDALLADIEDEDEPRHCDECGAVCDPAVCPYPPVQ